MIGVYAWIHGGKRRYINVKLLNLRVGSKHLETPKNVETSHGRRGSPTVVGWPWKQREQQSINRFKPAVILHG
jgi:hypothetical protein